MFFPNDEEKNVVPVGSISGEKMANDKWKITFDVIFHSDENRKLTEIFTLK